MRDEIPSPYAITFSFRRIFHHVVWWHSIGDVHAGMNVLRASGVTEARIHLRIDFHRHDRDSGSGSELRSSMR